MEKLNFKNVEQMFNSRFFKRQMEANIRHILCFTDKKCNFILDANSEDSYTDGNKIVVGLNKKYANLSLDLLSGIIKATTGHEASHVRWSNFNGLKNFIEEAMRKGYNTELAKALANIIEDGRIERLLCIELPGFKKFITFKNLTLIYEDGELEDSGLLNNLVNTILFVAKTGLYPTNFETLFTELEQKTFDLKIKPRVLKGVNSNSYKTVFDMVFEILEIFEDLLPEQEEIDLQQFIDWLNQEYTTSNGEDDKSNDKELPPTASKSFKIVVSNSPQNQQKSSKKEKSSDEDEKGDKDSSDNKEKSNQGDSADNGQQDSSEDGAESSSKGNDSSTESEEDSTDASNSSSENGDDSSDDKGSSSENGDSSNENGEDSNDEQGDGDSSEGGLPSDKGDSSNDDNSSDSDNGNDSKNDSKPNNEGNPNSQNTNSDSQDKEESSKQGRNFDNDCQVIPNHIPSTVDTSQEEGSYELQQEDLIENIKALVEDEIVKAFENDTKLAKIEEQREKESKQNSYHSSIDVSAINSNYDSRGQEPNFKYVYPELPFMNPPSEFNMRIKGLENQFKRVLRNDNSSYKNQRKGRIDASNLWKLSINERDIFSKKNAQDKSDYAVYILIDMSGSMDNACKYRNAIGTALTIEHALMNIDGVEIKTVGFDWSKGCGSRLRVFKDFKEKRSRTPFVYSHDLTGNSNRDGFAIRVALEDLKKHGAKNKLLIVISDGMPACGVEKFEDSIADVKDAVHKGRKMATIMSILINDGPIWEQTKECFHHMYEAKGSIMVDVKNEPENLINNVVLYLKNMFKKK